MSVLRTHRKPFVCDTSDISWVHVDGRTLVVKKERAENRGRASTSHGHLSDGRIRSPMPGKVLKICFEKGATVSAGVTVCILEAMKMEYALKAPFDGIIADISKPTGSFVTLDEVLLLIEPTATKRAEK